jgi:hypothetical protein
MRTAALSDLSRALVLAVLASALLLGVVLLTIPSVSAEDVAAPVTEEVVYIDSDVGDGGLNGVGASDWAMFAMLLAPFLVLFSGLMWLTFGIDKSHGDEE